MSADKQENADNKNNTKPKDEPLLDKKTESSSKQANKFDLNCCLKQLNIASHSVLRIYYLRFLIITVYTVGLLSSIALSLDKAGALGFIIGIIASVSMSFFDYSMLKRQTLFSYSASKLEGQLRNNCKGEQCKEEECGAFTLYLLNFVKGKDCSSLKGKTFQDVANRWSMIKYFFFSRGIFYLSTALFLVACIVIWISWGIPIIPNSK